LPVHILIIAGRAVFVRWQLYQQFHNS
jgi:hypothetical protein